MEITRFIEKDAIDCQALQTVSISAIFLRAFLRLGKHATITDRQMDALTARLPATQADLL